ncbi:translocation/assembly module TamB domain-containing protein [Erythrobacter sp. Alg231-14]|uniref:translocation/assembly module TamB domain-containing protein n=1 Tax=Erythrobacter sp. Alg231-14 TaxID=1922225 RepID=UPI000D54C89E
MAEETNTAPANADAPESGKGNKRRWAKRIGWALAILLTPFVLIAIVLSTSIGKRIITDQIAQISPASGLAFEVGRIEGDIYGEAVLHDVTVKDPQGAFLTIPEVTLSWRPLAWLWSGVDIRELTARRGTLERLPELLPGDPDAPFLPDFDIRVDRFEIDNLTLAEGVAGEDAQRVDLAAKIDIRKGRALVDANGTFGPEDRIKLLLDARPDGDAFDLALDYYAAADGPIAAMAGLGAAYRARIEGDGRWSRWLGHGVMTREIATGNGDADGLQQVAGFRLTNDAGVYGLIGQVRPTLTDGSIMDRALGNAVSLALNGTLTDATFDGDIVAVSDALRVGGSGIVDLAGNRADGFEMRALLRDPELMAGIVQLDGTRATAVLDGPFRDLSIDHNLTVETLTAPGDVTGQRLGQSGVATFDGEALRVPLNVTAQSFVTGAEWLDPRLVGGTLNGALTVTGSRLEADNTRVVFPGLEAQLTLRGNMTSGAYTLAGPIDARAFEIDDVGRINANSKFNLAFGSGAPWTLTASVAGALNDLSNSTIARFAGDPLRFDGELSMGGATPFELNDVALESAQLSARIDSQLLEGRTTLTGGGRHSEFGAFTIDADIADDGPRATLVLADPFPTAGLSDVRVGIAPNGAGFGLDVSGGSMLGAFDGRLGLSLPSDGPTKIIIDALNVHRTNVTGALELLDSGIAGSLALNGGGLDGAIALSPGDAGTQGFGLDVAARRARFGGDIPIALAFADIKARGGIDAESSHVEVDIDGRGLEYGALSLANFAAQAEIVDGRGNVQASIAGRRADRFAVKMDGQFTPDRIALIAEGEYGGRPITMPRRAVLTRLENGGYRLAPTQIGFARGFTIVEGEMSGDRTALEARLARMPLRLADLAGADLGLGGRVSGLLSWSQNGAAAPIANARMQIEGFTRSGLVLSSRPVDVFAVANLNARELAWGARLLEGDTQLGRINGRIAMPSVDGRSLSDRLMRGRLDARFGFDGPAQSLWRLAAIEAFDLTGPLSVDARATGTLNAPRIAGDLSSDDLRLQSAISGTDIDNVSARGRFAGSRLELTRFTGTTDGNGTVSGSGFVDFADMSANRGPQIDIRAAVDKARLLNANGLDATITGPLRIVSDGVGGAIAGRVAVDRASWTLGVAAEDLRLPTIATTEINRSDQSTPRASTAAGTWRYLVDARARNRIAVDGLGLDSEWGADIALRGTVDDPRIGGEARLVRGDYTFAGTRFDLTEGRIEFDASEAIDPRLDITAEASANDTDVRIAITGNAQTPQIDFSSTPALPEEEILARLLFGGSVTSLSATDAVQLGAALAALQGGNGGLDPIGQLRRSIGLDQLRIVSADPALGRGTGVALGKNLGRRVYVELVTDGQGYSATQVEYRITSWLALLGSITTVGRDSVLAEISRDY